MQWYQDALRPREGWSQRFAADAGNKDATASYDRPRPTGRARRDQHFNLSEGRRTTHPARRYQDARLSIQVFGMATYFRNRDAAWETLHES